MAVKSKKLPVITIDEQIAQLKAKREAELAQEIEQLKLLAEVDEARFDLQQKMQGEYNVLLKKHEDEDRELRKKFVQYKKDFEKRYGQPLENESEKPYQPSISLNEKLKMVAEMTNIDGTPKYKLNADRTAVIGAKGEELKSTIVFKFNGRKQTLNAKNLLAYLKK